MSYPYVERTEKTRNKRRKKIKGAMLDVEIHPNPALDENRAGGAMERNGRLMNESTPVEQGLDFANSIGNLDRGEMSATSSSFSERAKKFLGNFSSFTMGTGTGVEIDIQGEEEDKGER